MQTRTHTRLREHTHIHVHLHTQADTHTYTHTHAYEHVFWSSGRSLSSSLMSVRPGLRGVISTLRQPSPADRRRKEEAAPRPMGAYLNAPETGSRLMTLYYCSPD